MARCKSPLRFHSWGLLQYAYVIFFTLGRDKTTPNSFGSPIVEWTWNERLPFDLALRHSLWSLSTLYCVLQLYDEWVRVPLLSSHPYTTLSFDACEGKCTYLFFGTLLWAPWPFWQREPSDPTMCPNIGPLCLLVGLSHTIKELGCCFIRLSYQTAWIELIIQYSIFRT